ncbi:MAG: adenylyltransferase/cytidyltransferase family protein [Lachnospiraceae bacterium]|nr:adenylyltransferase/cytidyltransferase family protein [Lachnospiraceae bacterium]
MVKNTDIHKVNIENGTLEKLVKCFIKSAEIVFITMEDGEMVKLIGAVTEGDMKRFFRNMDKISFRELVNTNIKYIIYNNEKQVYDDAGKIFSANGKINNIPIVDESGNLLFQIDRSSKNANLLQAFRNISEATRNGSMEYFLESVPGREIIITGADESFLHKTEQVFYKHYGKLISELDITINTEENISLKSGFNNKTIIVSMNWFSFMYLYNMKKIRTDIITAYELKNYYNLKDINKYDKDILSNFMDVFSYKAVAFYYLNSDGFYFIKNLKSCGIKVYDLKKNTRFSNQLINRIDSGLDVFLVSGDNEEYIEKITIIDLLILIKRVWWYKQLNGRQLAYDIFMEYCAGYIISLYNKGFKGFLQSIDSYWNLELYHNINGKCDIEFINKWADMKDGNRYIIDKKVSKGQVCLNLVISIKEHLLQCICEYLLYSLIKKKCNNIYVCSSILSFPGIKHGERNRYNYIENKDFFIDNFEKNITTGDEVYLTEVIRDTAGCQTVKLNDFYYKFLSNYHSRYFNTDLYGNRIVINTPKEWNGTIWIMGTCFFSGYAVEDRHTTASFIQSYVNEAGYKYRVVNLACDSGGGMTSYNKLLEKNITSEDIVIIQTKAFIQVNNFISIDYNELNDSLTEKIWFWDDFNHMGYAGYKFMAKKIFKFIEPGMAKEGFKYIFCLESGLEDKIDKYIMNTKKLLEEKPNYQLAYNIQKSNCSGIRKAKAGAVVMNCNPFTYGHQYLIETASRLVDLLYVFVVEEDKSIFTFEDRFNMVKEGTKQYNNVIVIPSGGFMISSVTFPGYFMKDTPTGKSYDDFLDLKIFAHYIAVAFGITMRFVGEEPYDKVTAQYNNDMKVLLKETGITVIEIPRKRFGSDFISATKVRKLIEKKDYISLKNYLPETTIKELTRSCVLK